jgi:hypothetical protein
MGAPSFLFTSLLRTTTAALSKSAHGTRALRDEVLANLIGFARARVCIFEQTSNELGCKFLKKLAVKGSMQPRRSFASLMIRERERQIEVCRMMVFRIICTVIAAIAWAAPITVQKLVAEDSKKPSSSITNAPLSADQVVDNLVRKNQERASSAAL